MFRQSLVFYLFLGFFLGPGPVGAIFDLRTNKESLPDLEQKKWLAVVQGCHSCNELLKELETFCGGKKPSPQKLGFLIAGSRIENMKKKLKAYNESYERFAGSPGEFWTRYQIMASPSLKTKSELIVGKRAILKRLKQSLDFCL